MRCHQSFKPIVLLGRFQVIYTKFQLSLFLSVKKDDVFSLINCPLRIQKCQNSLTRIDSIALKIEAAIQVSSEQFSMEKSPFPQPQMTSPILSISLKKSIKVKKTDTTPTSTKGRRNVFYFKGPKVSPLP